MWLSKRRGDGEVRSWREEKNGEGGSEVGWVEVSTKVGGMMDRWKGREDEKDVDAGDLCRDGNGMVVVTRLGDSVHVSYKVTVPQSQPQSQ